MKALAILALAIGVAGCDDRYTGVIGRTPTGPAPSVLAFSVQPSNTVVNTAINPPIQVTIRDASGNTVTSSTAPVTLSILGGTGTTGAVLSGGGQVNAVNGVATFNNVRVDRAGTAYALVATSPNLTAATSTAFNVVP